jgi:hypothetical protein
MLVEKALCHQLKLKLLTKLLMPANKLQRLNNEMQWLLKLRWLDLRVTVTSASSKDVKLMHVLIEASHQLMAEEPLANSGGRVGRGGRGGLP